MVHMMVGAFRTKPMEKPKKKYNSEEEDRKSGRSCFVLSVFAIS